MELKIDLGSSCWRFINIGNKSNSVEDLVIIRSQRNSEAGIKVNPRTKLLTFDLLFELFYFCKGYVNIQKKNLFMLDGYLFFFEFQVFCSK